MEERGYIDGTVCPVVPTPVGTGVLIAGGNFNSTDHNWIYDNWRYGTMQFWVPAPLRDEFDPAKLYDTSHDNHTTANLMGIAKDGSVHHNGTRPLVGRRGWRQLLAGQHLLPRRPRPPTSPSPPPSCDAGGSLFTPGRAGQGRRLPVLQPVRPQRPDLRHPPGCEWFDDPVRPSAAGRRGRRVRHHPAGTGRARGAAAATGMGSSASAALRRRRAA